MRKLATIKDIAKMTGVSPTTVANVIHGRVEKVSKETQEKVSKALKEQNYTAHMGGRLLAKNGSRIIGVIIQDSAAVSDHVYDNPYQGELIQAIERCICEQGYFMMFRRISSLDEGLKLVEMWNLEGLILSGTKSEEIEEWRKFLSVPIVFLDMYIDGNYLRDMNVGIRDYDGGKLIGDYLLEKGHRKMAFIAHGDVENGINGLDRIRANGFQNSSTSLDIQINLLYAPTPRKNYHKFIDTLIKKEMQNYTALFFASDLLAIQAMSQFYNHGIKIPDDISLVSFDGTLITQYATPKITVIKQNVFNKAKNTVNLLIQSIEKKELFLDSIILPVQFIEGESVLDLNKS